MPDNQSAAPFFSIVSIASIKRTMSGPPCRNGDSCHFLASGNCRFYHPGAGNGMMSAPPMQMGYGGGVPAPYGGNGMMAGAPSFDNSSTGCRYGASCRFCAMGTCRYAQGNSAPQQAPQQHGNRGGNSGGDVFTNEEHAALEKAVSESQKAQTPPPPPAATGQPAAATRATRRARSGTASKRIFGALSKQYEIKTLDSGVSITWWDARTGTETRDTDANISILSNEITEESLGMTAEYGRDGLGPMVRMAATDLDLFWSLVHYYHTNNSTGSPRWDEKIRAGIAAFAENGVPSGDLPEEVMLFRVRIPSEENRQ